MSKDVEKALKGSDVMKDKCKWLVLVISCVVLITVMLNRNVIYDNVLVLINNQLLSEMSEEVGGDIIDINWGDDLDYRVHYKGNNICLEHRRENEFLELLTGVYKYKIENDNFYVLSIDGNAVIDRRGNALVLLSNNEKQIEDSKITYLSSENDFGEMHRRIFEYIDDKIVFKNGI